MTKILIIITLLSSIVFSKMITIQKEAQGYGITKKAAITDALLQAIQQTQGVSLKSVKSMKQLMNEYSVEKNGDEEFGSTMASEVKNNILSVTKGTISSYDIQSIEQSENNTGWEATITVYMKKYKTPGHSPHKRRKLVIVPSYSDDIAFNIMGEYKRSKVISKRLTQELVSTITQTRKFTVLDRENNRAYQNEKNLILNKDTDKNELMKLGNVLGTDYLVVSTITDFKISNNKEHISITGQTIDHLETTATIQYRIIAMATKQIKWSNTTTFEFKPKGKNAEQFFSYSLKKISDDLTYEIIENIYPIKIASISRNGNVILSQSSKVGTVYDVFDLGEKLYDSYTKEFLGYDEVQTGTIKIVRSLPKIAYAEIIEGDATKGSICRIHKNVKVTTNYTNEIENDKPSDVKQNSSGGVILPF